MDPVQAAYKAFWDGIGTSGVSTEDAMRKAIEAYEAAKAEPEIPVSDVQAGDVVKLIGYEKNRIVHGLVGNLISCMNTSRVLCCPIRTSDIERIVSRPSLTAGDVVEHKHTGVRSVVVSSTVDYMNTYRSEFRRILCAEDAK